MRNNSNQVSETPQVSDLPGHGVGIGSDGVGGAVSGWGSAVETSAEDAAWLLEATARRLSAPERMNQQHHVNRELIPYFRTNQPGTGLTPFG
jgi:hypothetical protein